MKKLTTKIMDNGKEKDIAVFLDDETAKVLEECGDEELKHRYIVEEYKDKLIERRETRRHQSLEKSIESGHEFVDHKADVEQNLEKKEEIEQLYKESRPLSDCIKAFHSGFSTPNSLSFSSNTSGSSTIPSVSFSRNSYMVTPILASAFAVIPVTGIIPSQV